MSKKLKIIIAIAVPLLIAAYFLIQVFGPLVQQPAKKYIYIKQGADYTAVIQELKKEGVIKNENWFKRVSGWLKFTSPKPGRYKIEDNSSIYSLVKKLRNGQHDPVNFVITKIRTPERLAARMAQYLETDSLTAINFLKNNVALRAYGLDTFTVMAAVLPLSYSTNWSTTPQALYEKFYEAYKNFWNEKRVQQAAKLQLSPTEVVTIASIIDEETNASAEKPNIASVYLNRVKKGMPLQADPTVKYALRNFALKRILNVHLKTPSPYNTYVNKGLPPGPICTPALATIDDVLNAPATDYLYFVANSNFSGTHIFTTNYDDHLKYARLFQEALNKRNIK